MSTPNIEEEVRKSKFRAVFDSIFKRSGSSRDKKLAKDLEDGTTKSAVNALNEVKADKSFNLMKKLLNKFLGKRFSGSIAKILLKVLPSGVLKGLQDISEGLKKVGEGLKNAKTVRKIFKLSAYGLAGATALFIVLLLACAFFIVYSFFKLRSISKTLKSIIKDEESGLNESTGYLFEEEKIVYNYKRKVKIPKILGLVAFLAIFVASSIKLIKTGKKEEIKKVAIGSASLLGAVVGFKVMPQILKKMKENWHEVKA